VKLHDLVEHIDIANGYVEVGSINTIKCFVFVSAVVVGDWWNSCSWCGVRAL